MTTILHPFLLVVAFLCCSTSAKQLFEDCTVQLDSGVTATVQCLAGSCSNSSCTCTSCKCYGLFRCTCNRGGGGCSASCLTDPAGSACDTGFSDGENAAPLFMGLFLIVSLAAVPFIVLCSTKCLAWRRKQIKDRKEAERTRSKTSDQK